jgi:hypothetical protein
MRINKEEKLKQFIKDWITSEIKRGNIEPDLKDFPKSSMIYGSYAAYEKHRTDLYNEYQSNPDKFRLKTKIWCKVHPEKKKGWDRTYRKQNKIILQEYQKNYRNNPEKRKQLLKQKKQYHQKLMKRNSPLLEKWRLELKKNYDALRWEVLLHYSPEGSTEPRCCCPNCPEILPFFMSIDHINGGGSAHRREVGSGRQFHKWLKDNDFPEGYRTMCFNCNHAREIMEDKKCPHELIDSNTNPFIDSSGTNDPTSLKDNVLITKY